MILLFDSPEPGPALEVAAVAALSLFIPEEIVDISELEEIRPDTKIQVVSRETVVLEEEAGPPTGRPASDEEVSSCHCPRERGRVIRRLLAARSP